MEKKGTEGKRGGGKENWKKTKGTENKQGSRREDEKAVTPRASPSWRHAVPNLSPFFPSDKLPELRS